MGSGKQIVRIENSDSDLRFREKVNRNFAALTTTSAIERATSSPTAIADIIAVLSTKADQVDLDTLEASRQAGTAQFPSLSIAPGATGTGTITFVVPFSSTPTVVVTPWSADATVSLSAVSATEFGYVIKNTGAGTLTSLDFSWMAVL